jgi:hypothetical protein
MRTVLIEALVRSRRSGIEKKAALTVVLKLFFFKVISKALAEDL